MTVYNFSAIRMLVNNLSRKKGHHITLDLDEFDFDSNDEYLIYTNNILEWCENHLKGNVYFNEFDVTIKICFEHKEDTMAFKLRWL